MNLWWTLLLGISVALMMYSKYHGVLIVLATLASNPKLFTRYQTYLVTLIALLAFTPHLYWQYTHGFPSVQFHLFERVAPILPHQVHHRIPRWSTGNGRTTDGLVADEVGVRLQAAGGIGAGLEVYVDYFLWFFLLSSFRGRVEANWTVPAFIALIVLSHQFLVKQFAWQTWLYKSLPITLGLILLARIYMLPVVPRASWIRKDEFHNNKDWVNEIRDRAQGLPVVFIGTYQKASKYWFYSQRPALSMNNIEYRRNNYNYWPIEDSLIGRRVMVVGNYDGLTQLERFEKSANLASHVYAPYYSFSRVNIKCENKPVLVNKQLSVSGTIDVAGKLPVPLSTGAL